MHYGAAGTRSISARLCISLVLLASANSLHAVELGAIAPDFVLPVLANPSPHTQTAAPHSEAQFAVLQLSDYRGRVVYLDFWQSSCLPCRDALPLLSRLRDEFDRNDVEILGVNTDSSPQDALAFMDAYPVTYPVVNDPGAAVARKYGLNGLPTAYLIGRDGTVQAVHEGFAPDDLNKIRAGLVALSTAVATTQK